MTENQIQLESHENMVQLAQHFLDTGTVLAVIRRGLLDELWARVKAVRDDPKILQEMADDLVKVQAAIATLLGEDPSIPVVKSGPDPVHKNVLLFPYSQEVISGGIHTPPELRTILFALGVGLRATDILETGYDAGHTTLALARTGANVVAIDNLSEYGEVDRKARLLLEGYPNVTLINGDALKYLGDAADESFDLIFIDDYHRAEHVMAEAYQVRRVLRPGGCAVFHDTIIHGLWAVMQRVFADWPMVQLPCFSPQAGRDYGAGLVRKPLEGV